jgi:AraC-like DNA-binding protein
MTAPEQGERLIFQCSSTVLNDFPPLEVISSLFSDVTVINHVSPEYQKSIAKKTMLEIYDEYYKKTELSELKIYLKLVKMFVCLHEGAASEKRDQMGCTSGKLDEYNERFGAVKKYIEKNYMEDITLDTLAEIAGYSKYHFSRIFKQYTGSSHIEYVNKTRINVAQKLLLDPDISITEVAMNSGFTSITSFNRVFKEIKHCTPSEFKKFYKSSD